MAQMHDTHAAHSNGHQTAALHHHVNPRPQLPETPEALTADVVARFSRFRGTAVLVISGLMLLAGIAGVILRISGGFEDRAAWGYYAAIFVWVLSTAQAAPLLSVATRLTKGFWRKPLVRAAELFAVAGIFNLLLMLPLLWVLPSLDHRRSFWSYDSGQGWAVWKHFGIEGPQFWLFVGMLALVLSGLGVLYASSRPDIATINDQTGRGGFLAGWAARWRGTPHQWRVLSQGINYLGIFYLMMFVGVHFVVAADLAIALVPGWRDPIFPAFHAISGIQGGLATLIIALGILRAMGGYREYLALDQFWNPAKLLLSFTLLWFYFWWSAFIIFWYGRTPGEVGVLMTVNFGPYFTPFVIGFVCNFVAPLLLLIWNPIRVSIWGPILASVIILVGNLMDRIRIYAGSFGVTDLEAHFVALDHVPATRMPDLADILVLVGAIGGVVFLYTLAMRAIPPMALWELREGQLLTRKRMLLRNEVIVIGKPE